MTENHSKDKDRHQDMKLKELISVWGPAEAEIIKSFLESQGILCLTRGQIIHSMYPFLSDGLGEIKIFVPENDFETAKKLLDSRVEDLPE
jgi:hypothetical protein